MARAPYPRAAAASTGSPQSTLGRRREAEGPRAVVVTSAPFRYTSPSPWILMSFRSRRGATGVELLAALLAANLVGAWTYGEEGYATFPSTYAREGGGKPQTATLTMGTTSGNAEFDTLNLLPRAGSKCLGTKTGCSYGGVDSALLEFQIPEKLTEDLGPIVLYQRAGIPKIKQSSTDDAEHFNQAETLLLAHGHLGGADVHCLELSSDEADALITETGLPSCGSFNLQSTHGDEPESTEGDEPAYSLETTIERIGRARATSRPGSDVLACIAYGNADGEVLSVSVYSSGDTGTHEFMDYVDDSCM